MINPYYIHDLQSSQQRLSSRVTAIFDKVFSPAFSVEERQTYSRLRFEFPLISEISDPTPLDFYAVANEKLVYMPILSLLFFEHLCTAYAWFHINGFVPDTIDEYVAMLKYIPPRKFENGKYPEPLSALHIPKDALSDPEVDALSLKFRNSGYAFILAHELGHLFFQHQGDMRYRKKIRVQEEEADQYAVELLKRSSVFPMGAILWFQANAYHSPHRGDFRTDTEWEDYLEKRATHPVTAKRLFSLSKYLQKSHREFDESGEDADNFKFIARGIHHIAETLNDEELQLYMASRVKKLRLDDLKPRPVTN